MLTATLYKSTGQIDTAARDRYVAREAAAMKRLRAKGRRDFVELTDEQIQEAAESLGRIYAHHFRVMVAV